MEEVKIPLVVAISGDPKTGKTHQAFTYPDPIAYFEFDIRGAAPVIPKFADKEIDVFSYPLPIIEDDSQAYALELDKKFRADYAKIVDSGKYQTVILDTSSMIWRIIGHAEQERVEHKLLARHYFGPNLKMNSLFTRAKNAGINMVSIQYLKDEYLKDEKTGKILTDGWNQTEATCDVIIWTNRRIVKTGRDKNDVIWESTIKGSRYEPEDGPVDGMVVENLDYDTLYALLGL